MLIIRLRICRREQHFRTAAQPPRKLNASTLKGQKKQQELSQEMDENTKDWDRNNSENDTEEKWATLNTVYRTVRDQYRFNEHDEDRKKLLEARNTAGQKNLLCYTRLKRRNGQRLGVSYRSTPRRWSPTGGMKKQRNENIVAERKDMKTFFIFSKEIYGTKPRETHNHKLRVMMVKRF